MIIVRQWVIGTAEGCDIRVTDEYASGQHARILRDEFGRNWVEDLGSTNGTRVRWPSGIEVKVTAPTPIMPGASLTVGRTTIPWTAHTTPKGDDE